VVEAPRGRWEFPDKVESLEGEGPCDQDHLEFLRGDVFLLGKVLASLTSPHDVLHVLNCSGPIEPCQKALPTKVFGATWWPQAPECISSKSLFPYSMGMHRSKILLVLL
jgi:hypothetical protein